MATVWGRATILVDADGTGLPAQVTIIAKKAGEEAGATSARSLSKSFREGIKKEETTMLGGLSNAFRRFGQQIRLTRKNVDGFNRSWKDLPHGLRQGVFWTGLVISSLTELATLSSVAGVGLLTLGNAVLALGVGLGTTIIGFTRFLGDIEKVPAAVLPARRAFDKLGESFGKLSDAIAVSMFQGTEDAWASFGTTIEGLIPAFESVGKVVNGLIKDLAKNIAPGTRAFKALSRTIELSGPIFGELLRIAGDLAVTLLDAFNNPAMQRALQGLLGWIGDLGRSFDRFVRSEQFTQWVDNGIRIFGDLGKLLEGVGDVLNNLVDQKAVDMLSDFIGDLEGFITGPGADILEFAKELNIFGLIAQLLNDIGTALEPLGGPLIDLAEGFRLVIESGIESLAPIVENVSKALAPFVQGIADFMKSNPKAVGDGLVAIGAGFAAIWTVGKIGDFVSVFGGVIGKLDEATRKAPTWRSGIGSALAGLASSFQSFDGEVKGEDIVNGIAGGILTGAVIGGPIGGAIGAVSALIASALGDLFDSNHGVWNNGWDQLFGQGNYEGGVIGDVKRWFDEGLGPAFENGWNQIITYLTVTIPGTWAEVDAMFAQGFTDLNTAASTGWASLMAPFENGWNQIVTFFTVQVPQWFGTLGAWFSSGFATVGAVVSSAWAAFKAPWVNGWNQIVNFFTVEVPGFFSRLGGDITNGVRSMATAFVNGFSNVYNTVKSWVDRILSYIQKLASNPLGAIGNVLSGQGLPRFASGGVLMGPRRILAGEAGPEAVVPLNRPLSAVDPSVRWLSAIAQGKGPVAMAGGGTVGNGRVVNIASGAVQVIGGADPERTSMSVLNRLAERIAG